MLQIMTCAASPSSPSASQLVQGLRAREAAVQMGLNMIRLWGGAGVTRKAFYDACDEAGILVWQEFCITGDCNGRGATPVRRPSAVWQARRRIRAACTSVLPG